MLNEGTPNPVLEAMACGVPVISTNVGIVEEAFGKIQSKFIMEERTIKCLKDKIRMFFDDNSYFKLCSEENIQRSQYWDWEIKVKRYKEFFEASYKKWMEEKE